jgi:hypothetical protein
MVMSRVAACPVSSFSLLSSSRLATEDVSAKPLLLEGVVIQPCTSEVTSSVTYCPAARGVKLLAAVPMVGAVA